MEIPYQMHESESDGEKQRAKRAELSHACAKEPELNRARMLWFVHHLMRRAEVVDDAADELLTTLVTASPTENLLEHLELIKVFPEHFEGQQVRRGCAVLEERIAALEYLQAQQRRESRGRSCAASTLPKEEDITPVKKDPLIVAHELPLLKMYRKMTQSEIIISLASEINQLRKEYDIMNQQHLAIQEAFSAIKDQKSWNVLCKCVKEVEHMRSVLDAMTAGQFEKGIIDYVDPRRVDNFEKKLINTDNNLRKMETCLDQLHNFKVKTEALLAKCNPILEQLYIAERKEDTSEQDLRNANKISERIGIMEVDVDKMTNIITALMARLEGRIALIEATIKKMELLEEAKADKDSFEESLDMMADKILMEQTVTYEEIIKVYNEIGQNLMDCFGSIMETMSAWSDVLEVFQLDAAQRINKFEFSMLLDIVEKKLNDLYTKIRDLEISHIHEIKDRTADEKQQHAFRDLRCTICDLDAVMCTRPDVGVPIMPAAPLRCRIAPHIANELYLLRDNGDYYRPWEETASIPAYKCPKEAPCKASMEIDHQCTKSGKKVCAKDQECAPENERESLMRVTDLCEYHHHKCDPPKSNTNKKEEGKAKSKDSRLSKKDTRK